MDLILRFIVMSWGDPVFLAAVFSLSPLTIFNKKHTSGEAEAYKHECSVKAVIFKGAQGNSICSPVL